MALSDTWKNKVDGVDDVLAEDINSIAEAVIQNEDDIKKLNEEKQTPLTDEQLANIDAVPNKADKTEVSNAVKETVTGTDIMLTDVSPLLDEIKININMNEVDIFNPGMKVYKTGKNIWERETEYDTNYETEISDYIEVISGRQYYLYCTRPKFGNNEKFGSVIYYDREKQQLGEDKLYELITSINISVAITIPSECYYIKVVFDYSASIADIKATYICETEEYIVGDDRMVTIPSPIESGTIIYTREIGSSLECEYNKDMNAVIDNIKPLELLYEGTTEEEVSSISLTTDLEGNTFELEELYATVKIATPNNISPNVYFTALGTSAYIGIGSLGTSSTVLIASWKRNQYAKAEHYQYSNTFKTSKIVEVSDAIKVNGFRLQVFNAVFPVGTEVKVWGKKVQ